jgi:hypothetical protein
MRIKWGVGEIQRCALTTPEELMVDPKSWIWDHNRCHQSTLQERKKEVAVKVVAQGEAKTLSQFLKTEVEVLQKTRFCISILSCLSYSIYQYRYVRPLSLQVR